MEGIEPLQAPYLTPLLPKAVRACRDFNIWFALT